MRKSASFANGPVQVVAAAPFETASLEALCKDKGIPVRFLYCGIGALNAAKCSLMIAQEIAGKDVIFVGTCGSVQPFTDVSLVRIVEAHWYPPCIRAEVAYKIRGIDQPYAFHKGAAWATATKSAKLLGSSTIALTAPDSGDFKKGEWVENLELYSVGHELEASAKTFTPILAITNQLGPDAHQQWLAHKDAAAQKTAEFIIAALTAIP